MIRFSWAFMIVLLLSITGAAQQRPLLTEDAETLKKGIVRIDVGFEFDQHQQFPLSGLTGDLTKVLDTRASIGLADNVEFQLEWTARNFLSIKERSTSAIPLKLGLNETDTNDVGDLTMWTKIRLRSESHGAPALGFRLGVQLPNTDQARGIGTNTTNVFGEVLAGKRFAKERLSVFGSAGIGILQAPIASFTQNDVLRFGAAMIYRVNDNLSLAGEVNGRHSTRNITPVGTEDYSQTRIGAQIRALGVRWYAAGIFGISDRAPRTGLAVGVTFDWKAF